MLTNWKTTVMGLLSLIFGLFQLASSSNTPQEKIQNGLSGIAAGIGLILAKDHNK